MTQTFTKYRTRITSVLRHFPQRLGVRLLGSEKQRVWGHLNGLETEALPDFGSDVMLISAACAASRNLKVDDRPEHRLELEFLDRSRAYTEGVVKDVEWRFGDSQHSIETNFHVLKGLPVDLLPSNDFLYDFDAFSEYEDFFYQNDQLASYEDARELNGVKHIGYFSGRLHDLYESYLSNCTTHSFP